MVALLISSKFKYALEKQQELRGLKVKSLKQEVVTRFTATHTLMKSFLLKEHDDDLTIDKNLEAVNQAGRV